MPVYCDESLICAGGDPGYSDFFVLALIVYVLTLAAGALIAVLFASHKLARKILNGELYKP